MLTVKFKPTGQLGTIPDNEFDPNIYEVAEAPKAPVIPQTPPIQPQQNYSAPQIQQPKSIEGFASNIGTSAVKNVKDIASGAINILNPNMDQNTLANLAKLGIDTAKLVAGDKNENNRAKRVMEFYKERYGGLDKIAETAYNDPVGVALDASTVIGGAGALAKGVGAVTKSSRLGSIGSALSKTSKAIDPIAQTSKLVKSAVGGVTGKVASATEKSRQGTAANLATRSVKANASQLEKFKDLTGQDLGKFMTDNAVYTLDDAEKVLKPLQGQYDDLVRTGKKVPGSIYAENLRSKALEIISNDQSPSARQLAEKIWEEADVQEKLGDVSDTVLTNTKSNVFNKVTDKSLIDPLSDNFNKVMGQVGIQTLDQIAPGSADVGKKLQAVRQFQEIAKRQTELGKGTQAFNILKPAFAGGVSGAAGGSFIPGIGNATGAVGGAVLAGAASSPAVQRGTSKLLLNGASVPKLAGTVGKALYNTGKVDRMNQVNAKTNQSISGSPQLESDQLTNPYGNNLPPSPEDVNMGGGMGAEPAPILPKTLNPYGVPPEVIYREYNNALDAGDGKTAARLRTMYEDEVAYQKQNKTDTKTSKFSEGDKKFAFAKQESQKALDILDTIKDIPVGPISGSSLMQKSRQLRGKMTTDETNFLSKVAVARTAAKNALLGANQSPQEVQSLLEFVFDASLPKEVLRDRIASFVDSMDTYMETIAGPETTQSLGATPPNL